MNGSYERRTYLVRQVDQPIPDQERKRRDDVKVLEEYRHVIVTALAAVGTTLA